MGVENRENQVRGNQPSSSIVSKEGAIYSFIGTEGADPIVIFRKNQGPRKANARIVEAKRLVEWASESGHIDELTGLQSRVLRARYLSEQGGVLSFALLKIRLGYDVTRSAIHDAHQRGIAALRKVKRGEPIRGRLQISILRIKELLNAGYNGSEVAKELGCSRRAIDLRISKYGDEFGIKVKEGDQEQEGGRSKKIKAFEGNTS